PDGCREITIAFRRIRQSNGAARPRRGESLWSGSALATHIPHDVGMAHARPASVLDTCQPILCPHSVSRGHTESQPAVDYARSTVYTAVAIIGGRGPSPQLYG